jgi:hypothetical protein
MAFVLSASAAYAHGGMAGPEELGRPLGASVVLAFISYWTVILWPARKSRGEGPAAGPRPRKRLRRPSANRAVDVASTARVEASREARRFSALSGSK